MNLILAIIGIQYLLRGVAGIWLRFNYFHPITFKFKSVNFEAAYGTGFARFLFIFLGIMVIVLSLII